VTVLSQPFPFLFLETKRAFLRARCGSDEPYALGHLFLERRFSAADFAAFLAQHHLERERARQVFAEMEEYSGQYTRLNPAAVDTVLVDDTFVPLVSALYRGLARRDVPISGGKETTCEEFLPHFVGEGVRCALTIRDPRDVLASLNHGSGPAFGGSLKPTLFNIRQWRKSVAFALELEGRAGFHWLRYEDLVADAAMQLQRLAEALQLGPVDRRTVTGEVHAQDGHPWAGNSSHGERRGISSESVGVYRRVLPPDVTRFVEAACFAELRLLGYAMTTEERDVPEILHSFCEPYHTRTELAADAPSAENTRREVRRFELLRGAGADDITLYFLFRRAYERLAVAVPR